MFDNKKSKPIRIILTVVYAVGIAMTLYFGIKCLLPSASEPNPAAMIPFTENESAFIIMACGFPLMLASCLSVIWAYGLRKSAKPRRNIILALIPAVIDGIPFVAVAGIVIVMLVEGFLEAFGILP